MATNADLLAWFIPNIDFSFFWNFKQRRNFIQQSLINIKT